MIRWLSFRSILLAWVLLSGWSASAASYRLMNGNLLTGEPIAPDARGVIVRQEDGSFSSRTAWTNFTEAALKELAKIPQAKQFVEPYLETEEEAEEEVARVEIKPKPVPRLPRLDAEAGLGAIFSSPISLTLVLLIYLANLYAAYEVSVFRNYPAALVCGLAVVFPIFAPILFLCLPTKLDLPKEEAYEVSPEELAAAQSYADDAAVAEVPVAAAPAAPAVPTLPPPTVYVRGQTTFNRRFFETKLAGFLRVVPTDAEKDMLLFVRSARGEHVGSRIARVTPNELYLQVTKGGASADVIIPFTDINEVQVRHKDA